MVHIVADSAVEDEDYPEPDDAEERCCYCGRKTYGDGGPTPVLSLCGEYMVSFKVSCARIPCLDAACADPDWSIRYPLGHAPS